MKIRTKSSMLLLALATLISGGRAQDTKLPERAPDGVEFSYQYIGPMGRSGRECRIEGGKLHFEERGSQKPRVKWEADVSPEELTALYKAFRRAAFDTIRNDERKAIVYDAGSESIALSLGADGFHRATYGPNSPLSGTSLSNYRSAREALMNLVDKHRKLREAAGHGDASASLEGTWRAAGDHGNGHTWYMQWKFAAGEFEMQGYPPILQKGRYRIEETSDEKLTIVLFGQSGNFGSEERTIEVIFGPGGEAKIDQLEGFRRSGN